MPDAAASDQAGAALDNGMPGEDVFENVTPPPVWPAPPFMAVADPPSGAAFQHAIVLSRQTSRLEGRLLRMLPDSRVVQFNLDRAASNIDIPYDDIEIMTTMEPIWRR